VLNPLRYVFDAFVLIVLSIFGSIMVIVMFVINSALFVWTLRRFFVRRYSPGTALVLLDDCTWSFIWKEGELRCVDDAKTFKDDVVIVKEKRIVTSSCFVDAFGVFETREKSYDVYVDVILPSGVVRTCSNIHDFSYEL